MSMYWTIKNWKPGDTAAVIIDEECVMVDVIKVKGSRRLNKEGDFFGKEGNVLIEEENGEQHWVLGGKLLTKENAIKAIAFKKKRFKD